MGQGLRVRRGATVVDLYNNAAKTYTQTVGLLKYRPTPPRITAAEYMDILQQGVDVSGLRWLDVAEPIVFDVSAATMADVRSYVTGLQCLLPTPEMYRARKLSMPCLLEFDPAEAGAWYQSEILSATVHWAEDILEGAWAACYAEVTVDVVRRFYWADDAPTYVKLTNSGGGPGDSATIYNHDDADAGHDNWATYAAAADFALPSPAYVALQNSTNVAAGDEALWVGQFVLFAGSTYPTLWFEGEAFTGAASQVDASSSGGAFGRSTWAGDAQARACYATLADDQLRRDKVRRFLVLARFPSDMSGPTVQCKLAYPVGASSSVIQEAETIALTADLVQGLGVLTLPPWLPCYEVGGTLESIQLEIWAQQTGGGTLDVDWVHLLPLDGYRLYEPIGEAVEYEDTIWDNQPLNSTSLLHNSTGAISGNLVASGGPLYVWPQGGKIFVVTRDETGAAAIDRTHVLQLLTRRRRLTL